MAKRTLFFAYGVVSYLMFLAVFLYSVGFIGNFMVPTTLDGEPTGSPVTALLVNLGLLALFAIQHSVMARPAFKRVWTRVVPVSIERSTYVLFSNLAMLLMFWLWQPMGGTIWNVNDPAGRATLYALFGAGWAILLVSTFLLNHFDLFGLRQVWLQLRGREYTHLPFATPGFYRTVRHPLYVGWILIFWATPTMTTAHLVFALMTTAYILIAIRFEERDLIETFGDRYRTYRDSVPMLLPSLRRVGAAGFAFFAIKGILWLVVPALVLMLRG